MACFQILSDLHLDEPSAYDVFTLPAQAPYLVLLGDIGRVQDDGLFLFLETQLRQFHTVFFLLGNHEPYDSDWTTGPLDSITNVPDATHLASYSGQHHRIGSCSRGGTPPCPDRRQDGPRPPWEQIPGFGRVDHTRPPNGAAVSDSPVDARDSRHGG